MRNNNIVPQIHDLTTADGARIRLTRWPGGSKGPVLVSHGVGVWSGMFALSTIQENFVQHLMVQGYDVWLLDWRGSIRMPFSQFTFDQVAEHDYPLAVRKICEVTKAESIQAVVHCAGATTFFMSMSLGLLPQVRCVAASQVALHFRVPLATRLKAEARLPETLARFRRQYMTPAEDPEYPIFQGLFGKGVDLAHHECTSTVCHRITFLYGHLYHHPSMNDDTHERLDEQFGKCNVTAFRHLAQCVRSGTARQFDWGEQEKQRRYGAPGPQSYLRAEHFKLPITFVSGEHNRTFLPVSTELTYRWLLEAHGPGLYRRHILPGYGHIDPFMGAHAARDAYPLFVEQLEAVPA